MGSGQKMLHVLTPLRQALQRDGFDFAFANNMIFNRAELNGRSEVFSERMPKTLQGLFDQQMFSLEETSANIIKPAVSSGRNVLIRYFTLDTLAAARVAFPDNIDRIREKEKEARSGLECDLTFFFKLSAEAGFQNLKPFPDMKDAEAIVYLSEMHTAYRKQLKEMPKDKVIILDTNESTRFLYSSILKKIGEILR